MEAGMAVHRENPRNLSSGFPSLPPLPARRSASAAASGPGQVGEGRSVHTSQIRFRDRPETAKSLVPEN
jgi:hypothetical protein